MIKDGPNPPSAFLTQKDKDEELYQRARYLYDSRIKLQQQGGPNAFLRAILIGEWQNIVFDGWLPIVMGQTGMFRNGLFLDQRVNYNNNVNPSIMNAFSTAAFR